MIERDDREWRERLAPLAPPAVDWAALEARILDRVRSLLHRRRYGPSPWQVLARWARPGVAAAAAVAALVAAAWLGSHGPRPRPTLDEALRPANGERFAALVFAQSEPRLDAVARLVLQPAR